MIRYFAWPPNAVQRQHGQQQGPFVVESGLVWTIVRPSALTDGPRSGLYRADERFLPVRGKRISRADVADFMYRVVADEPIAPPVTFP